jgi:membrane-associated protease RseP (regulator of RpoE activity)
MSQPLGHAESPLSSRHGEGPDQAHAEPSDPTRSEPEPQSQRAVRWRLPLGLFVATVVSVFLAGAHYGWSGDVAPSELEVLRNLHRGWSFAVPLLAILVTHEFGHYIAAVIHRVPASLPYFIPLPPSPFGTMGALIAMRSRIRSRNALLDIGAAGPLAGIVVALPVLAIGLHHSNVEKLPPGFGSLEGQCLLYSLLKHLVVGPIPDGYDVMLGPTAFAGWTGLLVTMLNLIPIGQLDGGHVAYALFDRAQNRIALLVHGALLAAFTYNFVSYGDPMPGLVWLVWFVLLWGMRRMSGENHPPTEPGELSKGRRAVAIGCLVLFVALFMPTPMRHAYVPLEPTIAAPIAAAVANAAGQR